MGIKITEKINYLIVDKSNLVVKGFKKKKNAEKYIQERPYLKIVELDLTNYDDNNDSEFDDQLPF